MHRVVISAEVALALGFSSGAPAYAQPRSEDAAAIAEALFEEGRRLSEAGKHEAACPKYAESQRLDPGVGVLLYLADCYEETGRTASAWVRFKEAVQAARAAGQPDRESMASGRMTALEKRLVRIMIEAPDPPPGLEVRRNGEVVGSAVLGIAFPIDPGPQVIEATAPSFPGFREEILATAEGETYRVLIRPAGASASTPGEEAPWSEPTEQVDESGGMSPMRTGAIVAGGVGVVGLVVGGLFGVQAISRWSDAKETCGGDVSQCPSRNVSAAQLEVDDARTQGLVSTIGFVVAGLGLGTAVALWFLDESDQAPASGALIPSVSITPDAEGRLGFAGIGLSGSF